MAFLPKIAPLERSCLRHGAKPSDAFGATFPRFAGEGVPTATPVQLAPAGGLRYPLVNQSDKFAANAGGIANTPCASVPYSRGMSASMSIGITAMQAAAARLQAASSNIANARTNGRMPTSTTTKEGEVYQPIDVSQRDLSSQGRPGGVGFSYVTQKNAYSMISDPNSPFADANGMVATPEIDLAVEMVNVIMAQAAFAAATKIVIASDEMQKTAVNMMA